MNQYNWTISDDALDNVNLATKWSDLEKILMKSTTPNNFVLNSQPRHWDELSKFEKGGKLVLFSSSQTLRWSVLNQAESIKHFTYRCFHLEMITSVPVRAFKMVTTK